MNNSPIAVTSPADILAFVPHALGFVPRESFVLMTMHGKRLGVTLRIDAHQEGNPEAFAASVIGYLANDQDADGSLFILYTTQPTLDGVKPFTAHAEALDTALHAAGMGIRDSWLVTDEHWMTYFCDDAECCATHPLGPGREHAPAAPRLPPRFHLGRGQTPAQQLTPGPTRRTQGTRPPRGPQGNSKTRGRHPSTAATLATLATATGGGTAPSSANHPSKPSDSSRRNRRVELVEVHSAITTKATKG